MNYEVLKHTPISGDFEEKHFGKIGTNPRWIKFNPIDSDCWIGSFASGDIGLINEKIDEINKTSKIGLLINGAFYLIDKDSRDLILHPENGFFIDFEILLDQNLIFLATYCGIYVFKDNKQIREIRPDFIDGIRFTKKIDNLLIGKICEPSNNGGEWSEFELNLHTLKIKWGKYEY
ncbi:MAG: hypothetical protein HOA61_12715 [Bacteroidetes bacterium]|jgi:hypothetical protein|nr:hypothetical protein [Bacteroidota bacterium]